MFFKGLGIPLRLQEFGSFRNELVAVGGKPLDFGSERPRHGPYSVKSISQLLFLRAINQFALRGLPEFPYH